MTLGLPGSAQLVVGNKRVGRIAMRIWILTLAVALLAAALVWMWPVLGLKVATNTFLLGALRTVLIAMAIGWAYLFFDVWRLGQPLSLLKNHRLAAVGVNAGVLLTVTAVLLFGAHVVGVQRGFLISVAGSGEVQGAKDGRFNVLLAGGDSGAGRNGLRPDSLTVASIDARTGRTVLIGLPRNMANFPFRDGSVMDEQFPGGFDCEGCMLNGVSTWAMDHTDLFGDDETPGMSATVQAVEGITGLEIGYWALVNMKGFRKLVDAFGGVELNVRDRIPVGLPHDSFFTYIEPGVRKLDGHDTLWFARARHGSDDYSRMARQKCVMSAMLTQLSPQRAVLNFQKIMGAGADMLSTNMPSSEFDTFISLAMQAKSQKMASVSLVPPLVSTGNPDIAVARGAVEKAIDRSEKPPAKKTGKKAGTETGSEAGQGSAVTGGSVGSLKSGYAANDAEDVGQVC
ncbi:LCP family protein [Nocardioides gilvus]|uniref:LCP family protein n=1 Tax=Nocardioides gilvus TaxID=1735589 RepID=UPI001EF5D49C|nr:LCP family protein [Nocardioides gilvus]